jgi:antirestriction protein ArdC
MNTQSLLKEVTTQIIQQLEAGVKPWRCPWVLPQSSRMLPYSACTDKPYSGINTLILWSQMMLKKYTTNGWVTFKQAHHRGGHVVKGEVGTRCFYYSILDVEEEVDGKIVINKKPFLKSFTVFNVDQIDGGNFSLSEEIPTEEKFEPHQRAEELVKATGAKVRIFGKAAYSPSQDIVFFPFRGAFQKVEDYYATVFHELVHWTGHETRLNRGKFSKFGDEKYAFEELVAELGSAFICADLGLLGDYANHASYVDSWLRLFKEHDNAILKAASLAAKAHKYIVPCTAVVGDAELVVNTHQPYKKGERSVIPHPVAKTVENYGAMYA